MSEDAVAVVVFVVVHVVFAYGVAFCDEGAAIEAGKRLLGGKCGSGDSSAVACCVLSVNNITD